MDFASLANENIDNDIRISYVTSDGYEMPHPHYHPHYELLIITGGSYTIYSNGKYITSDRPEIFIHCPYTLHSINTIGSAPYSRIILRFNKSLPDSLSNDLLDRASYRNVNLFHIIPNDCQLAELLHIADRIAAVISDDYILTQLYTAVLLRRLILLAKRGYGEILSNSVSYIQDAIQYIAENLCEPPTVADLAKRFGIGQSKFYSDFKTNTGMTYKKYLTDLRQNRAYNLLHSGAEIINTSLEVGYSSEAHFIKAFREYWGVTPGEFKKRLNSQGS